MHPWDRRMLTIWLALVAAAVVGLGLGRLLSR